MLLQEKIAYISCFINTHGCYAIHERCLYAEEYAKTCKEKFHEFHGFYLIHGTLPTLLLIPCSTTQ